MELQVHSNDLHGHIETYFPITFGSLNMVKRLNTVFTP